MHIIILFVLIVISSICVLMFLDSGEDLNYILFSLVLPTFIALGLFVILNLFIKKLMIIKNMYLLLVSAGTYMSSYIITSSILAYWAYTVHKTSGVFLFLFYLGILFTPFIIVAFLISFLLNKLFIKLYQVIDNYEFSKKTQ
jgi:hypothetical protein